ncbi:acetyltransferase [Enterococcus sp. MJM12]|uniref:Acetyltransferase n=1 Tax=Candidatus Enterococcus myersii TaxID=2815322 RepID=A0ABS3H3Z9_9ENTE|nr:acetyltransferase [Enterococcus sp. MJM12]MBO0448180.1 acetyltransferase [Enterococcus sp. MJM12]
MPRINRKIIIVGTGGFAKEVTFLLSRIENYQLLGYVDDNSDLHGNVILDYPVIGNTDYLLSLDEEWAIAIGIANPQAKKNIYKKLRTKSNLIFPNLIDPSALFGLEIEMGIGNIIMANTTFTSSIRLGNFNMINIATTIGHDVEIGSYNSLFPSINVSGNVRIGNETSIGVGSKIIQGLAVGEASIIGAGSVVIRDIESKTKNVGVPTRVIESWE